MACILNRQAPFLHPRRLWQSTSGRVVVCVLLLLLVLTYPLRVAADGELAAAGAADPYADLGIELAAQAAVVIETGRGMELYAHEGDTPVQIPALSKIMTALLVLQRFPASTYVTVSLAAEEANAGAAPRNHISGFAAGDKYTIEFLIAAMFYIDSDAAAIALAEQHSGSENAFTATMNERAAQLDMTQTVFLNSTGRAVSGTLDGNDADIQHSVSSVRDAIKLVRHFFQNTNYSRVVHTAFHSSSTRFFPTTDARSIEISNNLAYAWTFVDALTGVLASDDSGTISLVASYAAGGFETLTILTGVTPGAEISDLQLLGRGIYKNYINTVLVRAGQPVPETIRDAVEDTVFGLVYKRTVYYVQRVGAATVADQLRYTSAGPHRLPLLQEDTVGTMTFTLPNDTTITVECAPDRTIYSVDSSLANRILNAFQANPDLYIIILLCTGALALAVIYRVTSGLIRLYWRVRLRRAEREAGVDTQSIDLRDADADERRTT